MKFSIGTLFTLVGLTQAKQMINKKALLSKAVPVNADGSRRLEQQEEFEITGQYTLQFNHCLSLKVSSEGYEELLFDQTTEELTAKGEIVSQKSYVLFNLCMTGYCYDDSDDNLYMVDLASYMQAVVEGKQQEEEDFCGACEESAETCYPEEDENADEQQQDNADGGDNQDGGERKLTYKVYYDDVPYYVVDCDTCDAKGCFDEEAQYDENNYQLQDEDVAEWINGMVECQETEVAGYFGNLYGGFICNEAGTGVEPAVFLDNACVVYTAQYSYSDIMSGTDNSELMYMAADTVTFPFLNDIDCERVDYISIEDNENLAYEQAQAAYDNNGEQQEWEAPEASELCRGIVENSVDLDTCGGIEDDEEEEVDEEEDNYYSWYTYLVSAEDADDIQGSCMVVQVLDGDYEMGHTYHADGNEEYGTSGSGHVYDYKSSGASAGDFNAGKIFGIVIAIIVVAVAAVLVMQSMGDKKDGKKAPLVNNKAGAMA